MASRDIPALARLPQAGKTGHLPDHSSTTLLPWLEGLFAENGGIISFERFMQEALYHPTFGYYTAHIRTVGGSRGDFATSPTLSHLMGQAIGVWIRREIEATGLEPPWHVIEVGGGEGSLMREVIGTLEGRSGRSWWPFSRRSFHFHLVEVSGRLRDRQRETLGRHAGRVRWHDQLEDALQSARGEAVVFSNELVDAFPVVALRYDGERRDWEEVCLTFDRHEGLHERLVPLIDSRSNWDRAAFSALHDSLGWPDGQRIELHDSYRRWWANWAPHLRKGSLLTIDYGAPIATLYHRRPEGSLRAYFRHQRLTGPGIYRLFGRQDLTADVNFDDLTAWGEAGGFRPQATWSQADFLRSLAGDSATSLASVDRAAAFLLEPGGAGEAFQVLAQRKGA